MLLLLKNRTCGLPRSQHLDSEPLDSSATGYRPCLIADTELICAVAQVAVWRRPQRVSTLPEIEPGVFGSDLFILKSS